MTETVAALLVSRPHDVRGAEHDVGEFGAAVEQARRHTAACVATADELPRIAVLLPQGPRLPAALLGVMTAGVAVPLNPRLTSDELLFTMRDAAVDMLIVDDGANATRDAVAAATQLGVPVRRLTDEPLAARRPRTPTGHDTALLLHTSGTTARPKLVPLSHRNLLASAAAVAASMSLDGDDHGLAVMPLFHIHGIVGSLLSSLWAGAALTVAPFDALRVQGQLVRGRHTWMSAVPTMYQALLLRPPTAGDLLLRRMRSSSSTLPPSVWRAVEERFGCPVVNSYGMTEAAHQMCSTGIGTDTAEFATVGRAAGPEVAVLTASGVQHTGEGELVVRGPSITQGYVSPPGANDSAFVQSWFRTGDTGALHPDGRVVLQGRLKELINVGGEKVSPFEVDDVLLAHPAVGEAVAFAAPSRLLGEEVHAVVTLRTTVEEADLQRFAREHLAKFKVPTRIHIVDEIPKGSTGKVQRIRLAAELGVVPADVAQERSST